MGNQSETGSRRKRAPRKSRSEILAAMTDEWAGRVNIQLTDGESTQRLASGDTESAWLLVGMAARLTENDDWGAGWSPATRREVREWLHGALSDLYASRDAEDAARCLGLVKKSSGRSEFDNEGRDVRIVRLVEMLHDRGARLNNKSVVSAFDLAAEVALTKGIALSPAAIETIWGDRKK